MKKFSFIVNFIFICISVISIKLQAQWYVQYTDPGENFNDIIFTSNNTGFISSSDKLIKTTNGGNDWIELIQEPQSSIFIQSISFIDDTSGWYIEQNMNEYRFKIYKTTNGGNDWSLQYTSPLYSELWKLQFINQSIGYGLRGNILWKTTDGGYTWNTSNIDLVNSPLLNALFFLDIQNGWCWGTGLYKTTNGGNTWIKLYGPGEISVSEIQFKTPSVGWSSDTYGINKSTDGGATWTQQNLWGDGTHPSSLYFTNLDTGYFCTYNTILKTTNSGILWDVQYQDENANITNVCFADGNNGWAINNPGQILHTGNGGLPVELTNFYYLMHSLNDLELIWETATELNNRGFEIQKKKINSTGDDWKVIGFVKGMGTTVKPNSYSFFDKNLSSGALKYRLKQIDLDGTYKYSKEINVNVDIPFQFELSQNYPNPFNPTTTISWQSAVGSMQTLKVYDVLGREVATLVNEYRPAGKYEVSFNAANLTSGIYFYSLESGSFKQVKKMILLR